MQCIILLKLICIEYFSSAFIFQVLLLLFKLIFTVVSILAWKNLLDRAAWWSAVPAVAKIQI